MSFKLHYFRELSNPGTKDLRIVEINSAFPLDRSESCPACDSRLNVLAELIGEDNTIINLGACNNCGYIGYMARPQEGWSSEYYLDEWAANFRIYKIRKLNPRKKKVVEKAAQLLLDRNAPIFEVGFGKGDIMKGFRDLGFTNILGIENSRWLADFVQKNLGIKPYVGSMELDKNTTTIERQKLVISWHVIEHSFNPNKFLENISKLQENGDLLVLGLPNAEAEPMTQTVFWLPHLHAFSKPALEAILNRHCYELLSDDSEVDDEIIFFARKTISPKPKLKISGDYLEKYRSRLRNYFFIPSLRIGERYCFAWSPKKFHAHIYRVSNLEFIDRIRLFLKRVFYYASARLFRQFSNERSFVYSKFEDDDLPFKIRYDGNIKLLVR